MKIRAQLDESKTKSALKNHMDELKNDTDKLRRDIDELENVARRLNRDIGKLKNNATWIEKRHKGIEK